MNFDRWDICEAWWLYARDYHEGQGSWSHDILGRLYRMGYRPPRDFEVDQLTQNGLDIYERLVRATA